MIEIFLIHDPEPLEVIKQKSIKPYGLYKYSKYSFRGKMQNWNLNFSKNALSNTKLNYNLKCAEKRHFGLFSVWQFLNADHLCGHGLRDRHF